MKAYRDELQVPILLLEGDYGSGKPGPTAKELANKFGSRNVTAQVVVGCGHFMTDEQPHVIADLLQKQAECVCKDKFVATFRSRIPCPRYFTSYTCVHPDH